MCTCVCLNMCLCGSCVSECGKACDNGNVYILWGMSLSVCLHMCERKCISSVCFTTDFVCVCFMVSSNGCRQNLRGFDSYLCDYARLCVCVCVCSCVKREGFCVEPAGPNPVRACWLIALQHCSVKLPSNNPHTTFLGEMTRLSSVKQADDLPNQPKGARCLNVTLGLHN